MMSSQHGLYIQGYTHATMVGTMGSQTARWMRISIKADRQFRLQAATRLHEAGVASKRSVSHTALNTFPGLVHTARHVMEVGNT